MEHCKKLVLVPHETLSRIHEKPVSYTESTAISELDSEMQKILSQKAEDNEKWKMYNQTLQRYLHFVNEQRKPLEINLSLPDKENTENWRRDVNNRLMAQLSSVIPKKYKQNASTLFDSLCSPEAQTLLNWDSTGALRIQNKPVPQSNIIELISDATRNRRFAQALGWKNFAAVLIRLHTPIDLIANKEYKNFILAQRGSGITTAFFQDAPRNSEPNLRCSGTPPHPYPRPDTKPICRLTRPGCISKRDIKNKTWARWVFR